MKSVGQARAALPDEFVQRLYTIFSSPVADRILQGFAGERFTTLRVNTLKRDIRSLMATLRHRHIRFERVPWYEDALVITNDNERGLQRLSAYSQGEIYLQNLSSMLPPLVLNPKPEEHVLDLAAAPGSKTTQMAALMQDKGSILAVDVHKIRCERLKANVALQGATMVEVVNAPGERIGRLYPERFDRVLLDAPCSGEGTFRVNNGQSYRHWRRKLITKSRSVQRKLLASAYHALKPGGTMVYSTCTLAPEENELVVAQALAEFSGQLRVRSIPLRIPHSMPGLTRVDGKSTDSSLQRCLRVLPTSTTEGFFCCLLEKC